MLLLLVALRLDGTVFAAVDQLGTGRLEHVAGDVVDLCREVVELGAVPGRSTLLDLELPELLDLVQESPRGGVQLAIG
jgi:hypothetical protein